MTVEERKLLEAVARHDERLAHVEGQQKLLPRCYVTRAEFQPVKLITFGMIGVVAVLVLGAVVNLAIRGAP